MTTCEERQRGVAPGEACGAAPRARTLSRERPSWRGGDIVTCEELGLPVDAAGFSPRECPRCGAPFRARRSPRDARVIAAALARRIEHLNPDEAGSHPPARHCPYCGARASAEAWWTADQHAWFAVAARDLARELQWRRLITPLEHLGENPRPTYVVVAPRPAIRPAPRVGEDDLNAIPLPCCGEELKVSGDWTGPVRCHYCGFVHARGISRDAALELAQLRTWMARR